MRFTLENERRNMSRLTEKLKAASQVVGRQTAKIEARADAILAREPLLERHTDQAFSPHEALLYEAEQGVDALGRQLALLSNADPLEHSTPLPAATGATTDRVALGPHPDQPQGDTAPVTEVGQVTAQTFSAQQSDGAPVLELKDAAE
jgi:hypothetical protein